MRRHHPPLILATPLLAVLAAGPAFAQEAQTSAPAPSVRPFEVGLFGGVHFFDKLSGLGRFSDSPEDISPDTGPAFGLRLTYNLNKWLGIEAEGLIIPTRLRDDSTYVNVLGYRGQLILNLMHEGHFRPFITGGFGGYSSFPGDTTNVPRDTDGMFHLGLGAKFPLNDTFGLRLDGRVLAPGAVLGDVIDVGTETSFDGPDWEALASVYMAFGGSPPPPPPPAPPPPPPPAPAPVVDLDPDHDGIQGDADKCPTDPEDKDGFQDDDGCPDPDNDGDGIPDASDKCVGEPETKNNYQDEDGCPDEVPAEVKKFTGVIEGINFKTGSADILKGSFVVLDKAVKVLKDFPDVKLEISGHTDNVGKPEYNQDLSQRRADSVKNYFVSQGILGDRLTAVGRGMDQPIADNKTKEGKAKNRRTEFKLLGGN